MRTLILMMLVGCLPVTAGEPYPPIEHYDNGLNGVCSWAVAPTGDVVTAAHCINSETSAGFPEQGYMVIGEMNVEKDYAILTGDYPSGAQVYTEMGDPDIGEIACYYDFRGVPNCGYVTAISLDSIFVVMGTRMIIPGDSGSPMEMNDSGGLVGVVTTRYAGYIARVARLPL